MYRNGTTEAVCWIRHCLQFSGSLQSLPVLVRGSIVSSVQPCITQNQSLHVFMNYRVVGVAVCVACIL